jgi:type IV pilus assembly protein PilY1
MKQRPPSTEPKRSRRLLRHLFGAGSVAALLLSSGYAGADDLKAVAPNILLLVDTSGSMDYKTGTNVFPTCRYAGDTTTSDASERSRWIELVEVMTGSVNDYQCQKLDRNSDDFKTEYKLGGVDPYDALYPNPYHRPVNDQCVAGPGTLDPMNAAAFPAATAVKYHPFDNLASTCTFNQTQDGVLDTLSTQIRFGLMTFDTDPRPGPDVSGLWSYFLSSSRQGEPAGCLVPQDQEVGVRNAYAPPWEGRAVGFGDPSPGSNDYVTRNQMIQKVLLTTRPYGATPIAGMLDDARAFLTQDTNPDPLNTSIEFGPSNDPAIKGTDACRRQAIILLSDGQPNMDLRPFCEPDGCPYQKAEDVALDLKNNGIDTFVIGFALTKVVVDGLERTCASFADTDFDTSNANGICAENPDDSAIQACCSLNRIAAAGGPGVGPGNPVDWTRAHFATNRDELRREIQAAIAVKQPATTRLPAVPASGAGYVPRGLDPNFAVGFSLGASVEPRGENMLWTGELTRQRYLCKAKVTNGPKVPDLQPVDENKGDYFARNLNAAGPSGRTLFTVVGATPIKSDATMRPNLPVTVNDGGGTYSGTLGSYSSAGLAAAIPPEAIKVDATTCDIPTESLDLTADQCRDRYIKWWAGVDGTPTNHRCESPGVTTCALVADFLHAVPRPVPGQPNALINDASYDQFKAVQIAAKRPAVVYAATNDGFLHAFKLAEADPPNAAETMKVKSLASNELWGFIPPAVLPGVPSLYQGSRQLLLDGQMAIKDVVATFDNALVGYKYKLERSQTDAQAGGGTWRTILVQSFGAKRPGYYAIDITDPVPTGGNGPKLLWQLITDKDGEPIFGSGGGTPLITTVFLGGFEIPVAVLPGGHAQLSTSGPCTRKTTNFLNHAVYLNGQMPRTEIPCYDEDPSQKLARSLTVVRLDTGEILRTFRQDEDEVPALKARLVVTEAPLDAPITGQPVAFPSDAGAVADRVFVGDQDGTLWRLNLTSDDGNANDWTMDLFFDGFPGDGTFDHAYNDGQPIETPPIISVDRFGNLTVAFSTGRQEIIGGAPGVKNYVWSLTEKPSSDRTQLLPDANWYKVFSDTEGFRVVGNMALFSSNLYFATMGLKPEDSCGSGDGGVWAMHYIDPNPAGEGTGGVIDRTTLTGMGASTTDEYAQLEVIAEGGTLSGATVAQEPTCANTGLPGDDQYFSWDEHNALGNVQGGAFKLIIPIGKGDAVSGSPAQEVTLGEARGLAFGLQSPAISTRVDSWAAIVE